jgi:hypothetical protein
MSDAYYATTQPIPCPPFEKFVHPALCDRARNILEEVDNIIPECFIIKVPIDSAPR